MLASRRGSDNQSEGDTDLPRFRYCFYLDFLASQLDEPARNALLQLEEQAQFVRVLGSFPTRYVQAALSSSSSLSLRPLTPTCCRSQAP